MTTNDDGPVAKGTLTERPFPRLLFFLFRRRITGRVALVDDSGDRSIVFLREGYPVHVDRPNELDRLDRVLADTGVVSGKQIAEAEAARAATGRRLGDVLGSMGVPTTKLAAGLKEQLRRKLTRLFFLHRASFDVYQLDHSFGAGADFGIMRIDPLSVIFAGIKSGYDDPRLSLELAPVAGRLLRLNPSAVSDVGLMGFGSGEERLVAALRNDGLALEDLPKLGGRLAESKAAVLALLYSDLLEIRALARRSGAGAAAGPADDRAFVRTTPPPPNAAAHPTTSRTGEPAAGAPAPVDAKRGGPPPGWLPPRRTTPLRGAPTRAARTSSASPSPSPPPPGSEPRRLGADALRSSVADLMARLDKLNHFEVLGVAQAATPADVNAAYLRIVKQFHPDRVSAMGLADLRKDLERIMSRASDANAVLGDAKKRADYVKSLAFTDADRAKAMAALDAELSFQKGETFLKKGDFAKAEAAFAEAVKGNPDEPEHRALLAWTRYANPATASKDRAASDAVAILTEAVKTRPRFARGHVFLGEIWKQRRDVTKAEQAFSTALEIDPHLVDAQRELRLLQMRSPEKPAGGGLLDRLRKR